MIGISGIGGIGGVEHKKKARDKNKNTNKIDK
jgi:hypothetical protein